MEDALGRAGIELGRGTLANWIIRPAQWHYSRLYEARRRRCYRSHLSMPMTRRCNCVVCTGHHPKLKIALVQVANSAGAPGWHRSATLRRRHLSSALPTLLQLGTYCDSCQFRRVRDRGLTRFRPSSGSCILEAAAPLPRQSALVRRRILAHVSPLDGRCDEHPSEHVYSFDRHTKFGQPFR
jgi:hypothetical protein